MDITRTVEPKSDQLNFDDVAAHDLTITVTEVKAGPPDQPVELHNAEYPGRPYKPGKSMRRVLIAAWGTEATAYIGRKITLYGDPTIKFGKDAVGGIRVRALSNLTEPLTVALTVTRGKRAPFKVQPIATDPAERHAKAVAAILAAKTPADLDAVWAHVLKSRFETVEAIVAARAEVEGRFADG